MWLNTADNAEGEAVRVQIEQFAAKHGLLGHPADVRALNEQRSFPRAWEPEYLGHMTPVVNPPPVVEPFARPAKGPRCPEKPAPEREPTGLALDILQTQPVETSRIPEDWLDLAMPNEAKIDPNLRDLPAYSCPD
ncbi:MAG: hypothetical protein GY913_05430 [Proteobacteria bacterium]|nr:hypothetical protein [Pseudomonadota bacterium]MCP4916344.1 hypothetical protein [Pseudomonadota bacterium]